MSLATDFRAAAGLVAGLPPLLRRRLSLGPARDLIRRRLDEREAAFLSIVERGIFKFASSPYRPLFDAADCTFGDLAQMVRTHGLDHSLNVLRDAGVYVTFEEFKGRTPMVRNGRTIRVKTSDFTNPGHRPSLRTQTSGTTGQPPSASWDLAGLTDRSAHFLVAQDALGLTGAPLALWRGMLPAGAGLSFVLTASAAGNPPERWFTPIAPRDLTSPKKYPFANYSILALARLSGVNVPWPEHVPFDQALVVAQWAGNAVKRHGRCSLSIQGSAAVRMALAAVEAGLDLTGTTISGGGEPMTRAKARVIESAGIRCRQNYYSNETGAIGKSCGNPCEEGDVHLLTDSWVLRQVRRQVPGTSLEVDAFQLTTLNSTAPFLLLNVELDDYGIVEERRCGCPFDTLGLTTHIRRIRSFRKLTGEGVSLVASDMERILSEVLPAKFGGTPLDYQLVEDEDPTGLTRLRLAISPRVDIPNPGLVVDTVLQELAKSGAAADHARANWQQARSLEIIRREPTWTAAGKLMPLHLASRERSTAARSTPPEEDDRLLERAAWR